VISVKKLHKNFKQGEKRKKIGEAISFSEKKKIEDGEKAPTTRRKTGKKKKQTEWRKTQGEEKKMGRKDGKQTSLKGKVKQPQKLEGKRVLSICRL